MCACLAQVMATFELYRRSIVGMCLTEMLDKMVSSGALRPEMAIQVLVQFDKVLCYDMNRFFLWLWPCSPSDWNIILLILWMIKFIICLRFLCVQSMREALENQVKSKVTVKVRALETKSPFNFHIISVFACSVG